MTTDEPQSENEFKSEIYSISAQNDIMIYGGNSEQLFIHIAGQIFCVDLMFTDSISYCKLVQNYHKKMFYVVSYDGKIKLCHIVTEFDEISKMRISQNNGSSNQTENNLNNELILDKIAPISIFVRDLANLDSDISTCTLKNDILAVGCFDGSICIFSSEKGDFYTVQGTDQEILQVEICNQYILACTEREFMVFQGHFMIFRCENEFITGFKVSGRNIYLSTDKNVILYWFCQNSEFKQPQIDQKDFSQFLNTFERNDFRPNENLIQKKYEYHISNVENMVIIDETLIFAGSTLKMLTKNSEFSPNITDIVNIRAFGNILIMTTRDCSIYIGDYRSSFFTKRTSASFVYDFTVKDDELCLACACGIQIFKILNKITQNGTEYDLEEINDTNQ
ncbi:putative WD40/YVTN repeat-like-containing domain, WD40 repeat-like-containing domain protein [Pseudoloma neurophilia]|uniref:Putative WD40/YVTN repeat-like-containing domain, WD40 repeat-like-containing domain protein n=1 Tax=Pseudoloma neurophilia TaxID=146866 RepID=A0A0R0M0Q7_9MICR|nr:putative WD40/YVTN repeat-like-containing domain, WD40 repeat-like-containing domain protein [Pseudoloma neurophilia]